MKIDMSDISVQLSIFYPETASCSHSSTGIFTFAFIDSEQNVFDSDMLYVEYVSDLKPSIKNAEKLNLLCVGQEPLPEWLLEAKNINYIHLKSDISLKEVVLHLQVIFHDNYNYLNLSDNIIETLYSGKDLNDVAKLGHEIMGNPIIIHDTSYHQLAVSLDIYLLDDSLRIDAQTGWISPEVIEHLKNTQTLSQLFQSNYPIIVPPHIKNPGYSKFGTMSCAIRIHGIVAGFITVCGIERPFTENSKLLLVNLCKIASIELQKDESFIQHHGVSYEYFLRELLAGTLTDRKFILERFKTLDKKLLDNIYIITIRQNTSENNTKNTRYINQSQLRAFFPDSISTSYENAIAILVSRNKTENILLHQEAEEFQHHLKMNSLRAGVSNCFHDLTQIHKYYQQSNKAIDLGIHLNPDSNIYHYYDYAVYHIISKYGEKMDLTELCYPGLIELSQTETAKNLDLLETLKIYLSHSHDPLYAASLLHVHRNTMLYRINKIKEQLNLDLSDGNVVFQLLFSFRVIEYITGNIGTDYPSTRIER